MKIWLAEELGEEWKVRVQTAPRPLTLALQQEESLALPLELLQRAKDSQDIEIWTAVQEAPSSQCWN